MREHDCGKQVQREVWPGITTHPCVLSGTPCIQGTRIDTAMVMSRFRGGDSIARIAKDYRIEPQGIEQAIRYEHWLRVKRKRRPRARLRRTT